MSSNSTFGGSGPTERKRELLGHLERGLNQSQAARAMGVSQPTVNELVRHDPWVISEIREAEERRRTQRRYGREECEDIVIDAIDLARSVEAPGDMIRGASELAKLNGLYAPEEKKVVIEGSLEHLHKAFENMSDAELLEVLQEEQHAIEGEFERMEGE